MTLNEIHNALFELQKEALSNPEVRNFEVNYHKVDHIEKPWFSVFITLQDGTTTLKDADEDNTEVIDSIREFIHKKCSSSATFAVKVDFDYDADHISEVDAMKIAGHNSIKEGTCDEGVGYVTIKKVEITESNLQF